MAFCLWKRKLFEITLRSFLQRRDCKIYARCFKGFPGKIAAVVSDLGCRQHDLV
jgi:hypothetical protein